MLRFIDIACFLFIAIFIRCFTSSVRTDDSAFTSFHTFCLWRYRLYLKGAFLDSSILFLWYGSLDIHEKSLFPNFQLIRTLNL